MAKPVAEQPPKDPTDRPLGMVRELYERVASRWGAYGFEPPKIEVIGLERISRAYVASMAIEEAKPCLRGRLGLLLIPPTGQLESPIPAEIRRKQGERYGDRISFPFTTQPNESWRTLVIDGTVDSGIYVKSPAAFERQGKYIVAGYDTRALGIHEYAALSLQQPQLDRGTFALTWLLKPEDRQPDGQFPYASVDPSCVQFNAGPSQDDPYMFFRSAVEIQ